MWRRGGRGKGERAEEITGIVTNCQPYGDAKHVDRFFFRRVREFGTVKSLLIRKFISF